MVDRRKSRRIKQWYKFIISVPLFQVLAFFAAQLIIPLTLYIPPYCLISPDFNAMFVHVICGLMALVLSTFNYPN